jgi:rhomboid protease GluP
MIDGESETIAAASEATGLKRVPIPLMIAATVLSIGLYYPVWFLRRRSQLAALAERTRIPSWPFVLLIVAIALRIVMFALGIDGSSAVVPRVLSLNALANLALLVAWLLTVRQAFVVKKTLERYLAGADAVTGAPLVTVALSAPQTFLLGPFYLQHVINTAVVIQLADQSWAEIEAAEWAQFDESLKAVTPWVVVTPALAVINVAVFAAMMASGVDFRNTSDLIRWGANYGPLTNQGEPWRLLSAAFVHGGLLHLALNVFVLWRVGAITERLFGHVAVVVLYVLSALGGSLASLWWQPVTVSVGASGAVFGLFGGILGFLLLRRASIPQTAMSRLANYAASFVVANLVYGVTENVGTVLSAPAGAAASFIDVAAHVGGFAAGLVAGTALALPLLPGLGLARLWRAGLVGITGLVIVAAGRRTLPVYDDLGATLEEIRTLSAQTDAQYNEALEKLKADAMQPTEFSHVVEELLPPWESARQRLLRLRLVEPGRTLAIKMAEMMGFTAEAWKVTAQGVRTSDEDLVERANRKWEAVAQLKAKIDDIGRSRRRRGPALVAFLSPAKPGADTRITGLVTNQRGEKLDAVTLRLTCADYGAASAFSQAYQDVCKATPQVASDRLGNFEFTKVPAGPYVVTASSAGYRDDERDFDFEGYRSLSFSLRKQREPLSALMARLGTVEAQTVKAFNNGLAKLRAGAISQADFAAILKTQVLRPWNTARAAVIERIDSDDHGEPLARTARYMELRADAWSFLAEAMTTNDPAAFKRARDKEAAARALDDSFASPATPPR